MQSYSFYIFYRIVLKKRGPWSYIISYALFDGLIYMGGLIFGGGGAYICNGVNIRDLMGL